jgi:cobalt-zinc-cadmium efflux system outer membrane protein
MMTVRKAAFLLAGLLATAASAEPMTLGQALDAAATANLDVITAGNARDLAVAAVRSANTSPNPVLSYNVSQMPYGRFNGVAPFQVANKVVRVDETIEMGGKRGLRVAAAKAGLQAAGSDIADTGRQVRAAVTGAFYDLMAADARARRTRAIADSYAASLDLAARRLKAGDISAGDFARQKVDVMRAAADADAASGALLVARQPLAVLIGQPQAAPGLSAAGDWPQPPSAPPADADDLAQRRPDVRAAQARVDQARAALTGARRLRTPDVDVGVQFESQSNVVGVGHAIGFGVAVPLFIGNRFSGEIAAASTNLAQAEVVATRLQAQAVSEILAARSFAATASARRQRFESDLLPAARQAASTAEFAYARGAIALTDLLDARRALAAAELGAIDARDDEANALARQQAAETPEVTAKDLP